MLASSSNIMKLLPSGTLLAFQALSPSFSNNGDCLPNNKYLTFVLLVACTLSCIFFSFTDSFRGNDGKIHYGIATFKGLFVFDFDSGCGGDARIVSRNVGQYVSSNVDLWKYRIRWVDYVHAFFSVLVFHAVAVSDANVQRCFFRGCGPNGSALLVNLPLGVAFLSSMVFLMFPTSRKGIGCADATH